MLRSSLERQFDKTNFISPKRTPPKSPHRLGLKKIVSIYLYFLYKFTKIKIKSFECPKSIRNYKKIMLGTSDTWSMSHLSNRPSELY